MTDFHFFLVGAVLVLLGLTLTQVVFSLLKSRHIEVWEELGRPHVIFNNVPSHSVRWMKFLWKREYKKLDDVTVRFVANLAAILNLLVPVWLVFMFWIVLSGK